jgi:parallel beta-helix repeat protein
LDEVEINYSKIQFNNENGSLSGYVNDSFSNPIEGVLVSINCGGLHMHNTTDSTGFYYIGDVPIVDCYWNVTASKKGYETSWIEMPIDINSTYDFILTSSNNWLYVGGNGPNNYSRIQDAIDNASYGNTIFVYNGTYFENIKINKTIKLIGENKVTTIIDADNNGDVISVYADGVYITGFSVINSGKSEYPFYEFQGIFIDSNKNKIIGNIIYNTEQGITLNSSYENIILKNVIDKCNSHGIYQYRSNYNEILNNSLFNFNYSGISLIISNNNTISHNTISYSSSYGYGIILSHSNNNDILENSFIENRFGIEIRHSKNNNILRNNFLDNKRSAKFYALSPDSNNIWDCNFWNQGRILPKLIFGSYHLENDRIWVHWFNIDWHPAKEPFNINVEKNITPKCNTKWFFFCNINTSGFVDNAYEFLQGKYIGVM